MVAKIEYVSYKEEGFYKIINSINDNKERLSIFKLEEDSVEGYDYVFEDLRISNLKIKDIDERNHECEFVCSKRNFKNILKLIYGLKLKGDGGHSFTLSHNGEKMSWDGDGCDRITKINGIDCGSGVTQYMKHFMDYMNSEKSVSEGFSKLLINIAEQINEI